MDDQDNSPLAAGPLPNGPLPNGEDTAPAAGLISQYTKDLSFENPNAPAIYQNQTAPGIDVQFNIGAAQVGEEVHEVVLKIEARAEVEGTVAFIVDLTYAGLFGLRNVPPEHVQPFLLGEGPRLLFPFARRVSGRRRPRRRLPAAAARADRLQPALPPAAGSRRTGRQRSRGAGVTDESGPRARLGRRAHPRQPRARPRPRFAVRDLRRRRLRVRRLPDRLPPAQHVPRAVRGGCLLGSVHPAVQPQGRRSRRPRPARRHRLRRGRAVGAAARAGRHDRGDGGRRLADHLGAVGGVQRGRARAIRLRRRAVAADHSLSAAHQPRVALGRHPQLAAQILGQRRRADPAQRDADHRAARLPQPRAAVHRAQPGDRGHRVGRAPAALAVACLPPIGRAPPHQGSAPQPRRAQAADPRLARGGGDRRGADQPRHLDRARRHPAAFGLGIVHLLRRPAEPASRSA